MSDTNGHAPAPVFVQALALGLDPAWRRLSDDERRADSERWRDAMNEEPTSGVATTTFSSIGLEAGVDIVLWRVADSVERLERAGAAILREGIGRWLEVRHSFLAQMGPSQYVRRSAPNEQAFTQPERRYLIVYPFTKSTEWYLTPADERQRIMGDHMRVGHRFPMVRQALGYSFGLDSQDFVVAYETDDLAAFGALVHELRGTESRRATVLDTPVLLAVKRPVEEILELLGAPVPIGAALG